MLTVFSPEHKLHDAKTELSGGELVAPYECPARAEYVLKQIRQVGLGDVVTPEVFGLDPILRVHDPRYVEFLRDFWPQWRAAGNRGEGLPSVMPTRGMRQRVPQNINGKIGYYAMAAETAITAGTWSAVQTSANVALTAQAMVGTEKTSAFALCRPPGHHATGDQYGGYCFINNVAVCAQAFLDQGAERVAVLDVDFHHGNGTQSIFYERSDVMFQSIHGDPQYAFPYFLGFADEMGAGAGEGFNHNYPLAPGAAFDVWGAALLEACQKIEAYGPDVLAVSLGVDTFEGDPISFFRLTSDDFKRYGAILAGLKLPTLFVMEGGYAVREIGVNTVNVLTGFVSS